MPNIEAYKNQLAEGKRHLESKSYAAAIVCFERAVAESSSFPDAFHFLGVSHSVLRQLGKAEANLTAAVVILEEKVAQDAGNAAALMGLESSYYHLSLVETKWFDRFLSEASVEEANRHRELALGYVKRAMRLANDGEVTSRNKHRYDLLYYLKETQP